MYMMCCFVAFTCDSLHSQVLTFPSSLQTADRRLPSDAALVQITVMSRVYDNSLNSYSTFHT